MSDVLTVALMLQDGADFYADCGVPAIGWTEGQHVWSAPFVVGTDMQRAQVARAMFNVWARRQGVEPSF